MSTSDRFQLRLLGPVQLELDGRPVRGFQSRKAVGVLGYLVARAHSEPRGHLVDLFWPDLPEERGRANLSVVLHNLSGLLPGCFKADRHAICFRPGPDVTVDTLSFEALVASGRHTALARAVELYCGEFLAGLVVDDCPDFELWLVRQRNEWRERVVGALDGLIDYFARGEDYAEGVRYATRLLDLEPWHEKAHRRRMWLLACDGQRTAALMQYEACRQALADELGVLPSPETDALAERIRAGEIEARRFAGTRPLAEPHPHNLPLQLTAFFGRDAELAALAERLDNPKCRLVTVVGSGGSGKSRLALEAATAHLSAFPDGVFLVPLAAAESSSLLPSEIANAINLTLPGPEEPREGLIEHLHGRRMLLVLDNFEHLLDGADLLLDVLGSAPGVKLLVTSRSPLDLRAEWLVHVAGLPFPTDGEVCVSEDFPAMTLFAERARHVDEIFQLDELTWGPVARICQLVDGLPLALELASAWAGDMSCERIAAEIACSPDRLATTMRDVSPRHQSLRAVFEHSSRLLSPPERMAFAQLAVFRGGFTAEAGAEVAGATAEILHRLERVFFVRRAADGRYVIHQLLQQFGLDKLEHGDASTGILNGGTSTDTDGPPVPAWPKAQAVRLRHAQFFTALAEAAAPQLQGPEQTEWLDRLSTEHENLRAALAMALGLAHPRTVTLAGSNNASSSLALRVCGALWRFWWVRGHLNEGRALLSDALAHAGADAPPSAHAHALNGAGVLAWAQGEHGTALAYFERSLAIHRAIGDQHAVASLIHNLSAVAMDQGDSDDLARTLLEESLALRRTIGDQVGIAVSLNNLALIAERAGEYATARNLYEESLAISRELNDTSAMSRALNNLGVLAHNNSDIPSALAYHEESLAIRRGMGDKYYIARSLGNLAVVKESQEDYAEAETLLEQSLAIARELGDKRAVANGLSNLADVACARSDYSSARAHYRESLTIRMEMGDKRRLAFSLESFAALEAAEGRASTALRLFGTADALRKAIGSPLPQNEQARHDRSLAELRDAVGDEAFEAGLKAGAAMSLEDVVANLTA